MRQLYIVAFVISILFASQAQAQTQTSTKLFWASSYDTYGLTAYFDALDQVIAHTEFLKEEAVASRGDNYLDGIGKMWLAGEWVEVEYEVFNVGTYRYPDGRILVELAVRFEVSIESNYPGRPPRSP